MDKLKSLFLVPGFMILINISALYSGENQINKNRMKLVSENGKTTFLIKKTKNGAQGEIKSPYISGASLLGDLTITDHTEDIVFTIKKIKFMTSWFNGYTEGECSAAGQIIFKNRENYFESQVTGEFAILDVLKGKIRYDIYYYKGKEGTIRFKNRLDRIQATVDFLKTKRLKPFYKNARNKPGDEGSFKKDTQALLFPELFGFKYLENKNLLDNSFDPVCLEQKTDRFLSDEMIWRKSYTDQIFPEYLQEIRNTGSMYKDYEESLDIFFVLYNLDYFFNHLLSGDVFIKK
ncbi:MAG: hypothetical protein JXB50_05130 [Spirochaetes bacterium]|nr:hypothetical protein [Spirochaetota bacterium]